MIEISGFSPDGNRIVYYADSDEDEVFEIYSVLSDGAGIPQKISGDLVDRGDVQRSSARISPDGRRVLYIADQELDESFELFSSLIDGKDKPVKLNAPLQEGEEVIGYLVSPDSSTVAFRIAASGDDLGRLYSRRTDGSTDPILISGTGGATSPLATSTYKFSPDSTRVVFLGAGDRFSTRELYGAGVDDTNRPVKINEPVQGNFSGGLFEITPDSQNVVYSAEQDNEHRREIYIRSIDGSGDSIKLNSELSIDQAAYVMDLSRDGTHVIYGARDGTSRIWQAFIVPVDLGTPPELIASPEFGVLGGVLTCGGKGSHFVFFDRGANGDFFDIFSSKVSDGGPYEQDLLLSLPRLEGSVRSFTVSSDGKYVIYADSQAADDVVRLYVVPMFGGTPAAISPEPLGSGVVARSFRVAADDRSVVYRGEQDSIGVTELFLARFNIFDSGFEDVESCGAR